MATAAHPMKSPKSRGSSRKEEVVQKSAGFLLFKDLPEEEASLWLQAEDAAETQALVQKFLRLHSADCDVKEAALLDFYAAMALWCREQDASAAELSLMFATCKLLMEKLEAGADRAQLVMEIKRLLGSSDGAASGLESLEPQRLQALMEQLAHTVLQHHSLYAFALQQQPEQVIITQQVDVDALPLASVPFPAPLCEGLPEDLYRRAVLRSGTSRARTVVEEDVDAASDETDEEIAAEAAEAQQQQQQQQQQQDLQAAMQSLSAADIQGAVDSVCDEMLAGLESELAAKIKEREVNWINKINKVHNTA